MSEVGHEPSAQVVAPRLQEHPTSAFSRQEELPGEGKGVREVVLRARCDCGEVLVFVWHLVFVCIFSLLFIWYLYTICI